MRFKFTFPFFSFELYTDDFRARAHAAFDPLWRSGEMSRNAAYRWLANELGLSREECHISLFDRATCERVVAVCERNK
jgi:hypothetical protein